MIFVSAIPHYGVTLSKFVFPYSLPQTKNCRGLENERPAIRFYNSSILTFYNVQETNLICYISFLENQHQVFRYPVVKETEQSCSFDTLPQNDINDNNRMVSLDENDCPCLYPFSPLAFALNEELGK